MCGQAPGVLQVHWKPPPLSPTGTSNGANVIGYVVCTKGQRVSWGGGCSTSKTWISVFEVV